MNAEPSRQVAQVVWPWQAPAAGSAPAGSRRRRALVQCAVTAAVATLLTWGLRHYWFGLAVFALSGAVVISGFLIPPAFDALERAGQWLGRGVAAGLTWLLLVPFFYLCFAPARLLLRLRGKDPMHRRYERDRASYWTDRLPPAGPASYTRQY